MRTWRLNIAFADLPSSGNLLYQSPEVGVNSIAELCGFVTSMVNEWEALCRMFAICGPVLHDQGWFHSNPCQFTSAFLVCV